jgi:hypothetical protein
MGIARLTLRLLYDAGACSVLTYIEHSQRQLAPFVLLLLAVIK